MNPGLSMMLWHYGLTLYWIPKGQSIPGSYWGDEEAGLIGNGLYVRQDTPVHSALHEASHFVCAAPVRRAQLHTNVGSDDAEEDATCFLQILLADYVSGFSRAQMFTDMDAWGYSFRLGSAQRWFEEDADEARDWLLRHGVIHLNLQPTWRLRH